MNGESRISIKHVNLDSKSLEVNYVNCFICQLSRQQTSKGIVNQEELPQPTRQGIASLCRDLKSFMQCKRDSVPRHIELLFETSNQFEELMVANNARYHKQCRDKYNAQKLKRLEKKCKKISGEVSPEETIEISTSSNPVSYDEAYDTVFKEIVRIIENTRRSSDPEFYQLSQLAKILSERLDDLGFENITIHTSRLKDQLLATIPGFRADKIGREILLSFDENVKHLVSSAVKNEMNTEADVLAAAIDILRKTFIDKHHSVFSGSLNENFCPENTVSKTLATFISALMGNETTDSKVAENIAQLIQFNSVKKRNPESSYARHNINREQPLPLYIGLLIHSLTGKRSLIDELFEMGMCVSYSRVLDIERALASKVCEIYKKDDCVCPPHLSLGVFTTAAVDNIDHNPRSNSANYAFHGTGISLIQHYDEPNSDDYRQCIYLNKNDFASKSKPSLPKSYYDITSLPTEDDGEAPLPSVNWDSTLSSKQPLEYVMNWFESCNRLMSENSDKQISSWSAYNSRLTEDISKYKSTSVMLPLIKDNINSPSVVGHTMDIVISITKKINPMQTPVWTGDQPVYAIGKQLQWLYPEKYGEDKLVLMLGGLHIEKSFLAVVGTWLEGSGWEEMIVRCSLTTSGRAEGVLKSEHIKRARYAHEVSLAALHILLFELFESNKTAEDSEYLQWIETKRHQSAQFQYWITTMELEAILLQFVKALRTGNIDEYIVILDLMCPWYLVTDHTHYGRWLPVFVADLKRLRTINPQVYEQFKNGHFTSRQTNRKFSCISDDQLHEQNNKLVKESSSLLGMLNDEASIVKWMVSGPEISRLILEYKNLQSTKEDLRHHEDRKWFQSKFSTDVQNMVKEMRNKGPFSTEELSTIGHERKVMNEESKKHVIDASRMGLDKYRDYMFERLVTTKVSIHHTIKQSQLSIFKVKTEKKVNKEKMKLAAANVDSNLFCRLFIASEARKSNVTEFFMHENSRFPPSLSEFGSLRKSTTNDDLINCLMKNKRTNQSSRSYHDTPEAATVLVMNAFSHVQTSAPLSAMTVKSYSELIFNKIIDAKLENHIRVDVLFDVNNENSLEEMTKEVCNEEKYFSEVDNETKMQSGTMWFTKFLSKLKVKTQFLNALASNYVQSAFSERHKHVIGTGDCIVISCNETTDINFRLPIENINTRMLLHVEDAVRNGHSNVVLSTSDYNIVSVAIYAFKYLTPNLNQLWVEVLETKGTKIVPIHELYEQHTDKSDVLPFFNAFTGCSTSSAFFGIGKTTAWNTWIKFPDLTSAMIKLLTDATSKLSGEAMNIFEEYTVKMYDSSSKMTKVHDCRRDLFTRKSKPRTIDRIPPTRDALEQHVKRSMLQSMIWTQCIRKNIQNLKPTDWGWKNDEKTKKFVPVWVSIPIVAEHCKELITCKCPKQCSGRCNCIKNQLPCTMLCACEGNCRKESK